MKKVGIDKKRLVVKGLVLWLERVVDGWIFCLVLVIVFVLLRWGCFRVVVWLWFLVCCIIVWFVVMDLVIVCFVSVEKWLLVMWFSWWCLLGCICLWGLGFSFCVSWLVLVCWECYWIWDLVGWLVRVVVLEWGWIWCWLFGLWVWLVVLCSRVYLLVYIF